MVQLLIDHCKDSNPNPEQGDVHNTEEQLKSMLRQVKIKVEKKFERETMKEFVEKILQGMNVY